MIVVDTNVVAYLWIPGERTTDAERLLRLDPEWCAPLLWRSEFGSVLVGCLRRGWLDLTTAQRVADDAEAQMRHREYTVAADTVLERALASDCSACDCGFVALAEDLAVPLVTSDRRIIAAFPAIARDLATYALDADRR